jgi:hypothetical protein
VTAELDRHDDVPKEPLEQQAFEDARFALEALLAGLGEPFFLKPDPEKVRTPNDPFGERRGDPARCRLDALIVAPESLNPSHSGRRPPRNALELS